MNCQEFEGHINDLARGAMTDARTRAEAGTHEEACARCAAMLSDERALSTGLRALAASTRNADAPARVESALLAAFRARAAGAKTAGNAVGATTNVVPMHATANVKRWSWPRSVAVAAMAAAAALTLFMIIPPDAGVTPPQARSEVAKTVDTPARSLPNASATSTTTTQEQTSQTRVVEENATVGSNESNPEPPREARQPRTAQRAGVMNASYNRGAASAGRDSRAKTAAAARDEELATDFIPLPHASQSAGVVDTGQVVRVELPRSALSSLGFIVNADRAHERVKADVVIGEDGTARAIRFVR